MSSSNSIKPKLRALTMLLAFCAVPAMQTAHAGEADKIPVFSPVVNGEALRGLSTIGSAEAMGGGRITFSFLASGYRQQVGYLTAPNSGANIFTGAGAFSYGANDFVDLFASVTGYSSSNYTNTDRSAGLGTIRAGAQGSLPFPRSAFVRMGGQAAIIGGTSRNQINTYRADGYNYLETRTALDFLGKFLQTSRFGGEDFGFKFHTNEAGIFSIGKNDPALLLLGAGVQANLGFVVLGGELNSRTQFNQMRFDTDPLWVTPSIHFRTPYQMNAMFGADISLSANRSNNQPRALEPYRLFGSLAFSYDLLASRRAAALALKQKEAQEKAALEAENARKAEQLQSLADKSVADSIELEREKADGRMQMDSMQRDAYDKARMNEETAAVAARKATADSLALINAAGDLAAEREKRSDAEKMLLSTGELLLGGVYFETDKTTISINSKPYLDIIGKMLLKYPKLQIEVAGHTDNVGSVAYNITLSQGRADAVRTYLTQFAPALTSTLGAHGYGMSVPKADNKTADGRLTNRRVELRVTNKDALQQYSQ